MPLCLGNSIPFIGRKETEDKQFKSLQELYPKLLKLMGISPLMAPVELENKTEGANRSVFSNVLVSQVVS